MTDLADFEFSAAVLDGDRVAVARLLRRNHPLSTNDKMLLAASYEGKLKARRGRRPWCATDELRSPAKAAARRAAFLYGLFKAEDQRRGAPRKGRHARAMQRTFDYMASRRCLLPNRESVENLVRRSKRTKTPAALNPDIW
ncbi:MULTISPECIES: hypothetical protein [unclassified Bradyrhizobium]